MKLRINQSGSSIIMVLVIMTILSMVAMAALKSSLFVADFAQQCIASEQRFCVAQGLLNYGVAIAKVNFDEIVKHAEPAEIEIDGGTITLTPSKESIAIDARAYESGKPVRVLNCHISKNENTSFMIWGFQR